MSMAAFVSIIAALGALVLAVSGLRAHRLAFARALQLAVVWVLVILGLFVVFRFMGV